MRRHVTVMIAPSHSPPNDSGDSSPRWRGWRAEQDTAVVLSGKFEVYTQVENILTSINA